MVQCKTFTTSYKMAFFTPYTLGIKEELGKHLKSDVANTGQRMVVSVFSR